MSGLVTAADAPGVRIDPADPAPASADRQWHRVHPVTPLVKGWAVLVVLVLGVLRQGLDQLPRGGDSFAVAHVVQILLGLLAVVLVVGLFSWLSWRVTAYAVDADSVHMRSGLVRKQHRHARLDRVQAIDLRQPLVARLVGLAELRVEVAGGGDSELAIAYLTERQAQELRLDLLGRVARAADPRAADPRAADPRVAAPVSPAAPDDSAGPELQVYEVPSGRLLAATLLRGETVVLLAFVVATVIAIATSGSAAPAFTLLPVLLGLGSALFGRFNRSFAFRAATSPDGIRLRHGLTETRSQTIPVHRVQAVELYQPWLWRRPDWWRVQVNVAGYVRRGSNSGGAPTTVLLPVGTRDEAVTALWLVLPDLGVADPRPLVDDGLTGSADGAYTTAPRRSRVLDPVGWVRNGFAVLPRALFLRSGRLRRRLVVVPHGRTQSLGIEQGPWQRRLGLASFVVHSTPGPVAPRAAHLDATVARALLDEQSRRAQAARAGDARPGGAAGEAP